MSHRELELKWTSPRFTADWMGSWAAKSPAGFELVRQCDDIFALSREAILYPEAGTVVGRVRRQGGITCLTVKRRRSYYPLDKDEVNIAIESPQAGVELLELFGFRQQLRIVKERYIASLANDLTICFDIVQGLGNFVEIEMITPSAELREGHSSSSKEVESDFLARLRQAWPDLHDEVFHDSTQIVLDGYDTLILNRRKI